MKMPKYTTLTIEKLQVAVTQAITGDWDCLRQSLRVAAHRPPNLDLVAMQFLAFVNKTTRTVESRTVERPKTWWDGFKLEYFPHWLRQYFPVEHEQITVAHISHFLCPHPYFGGDKPDTHIHFMMQGTDNL